MLKGKITTLFLYLTAFVLAVYTGNLFNFDLHQIQALAPLAIAGIGAGAQLLGGIISGGSKRRAAKRMARKAAQDKRDAKRRSEQLIQELKDNPYKTPEEVRSALALSQQEMNSSSFRNTLDATADNALAGYIGTAKRAATSGADLLAAAQKGYGQSQEQKAQNAVTAEQKRQQDIQNVMAQSNVIGQHKDIEWQRNVYLPNAQAQELVQGELQDAANRFGGAQSALYNSAGIVGDAISAAGNIFGSLAGSDLFGGGGGGEAAAEATTATLSKRQARKAAKGLETVGGKGPFG